MTDTGLSAPEQEHVQRAADEAFRVLTGRDDYPARPKLRAIEALRRATIEAPLQSLAIAFLLGILVARPR
jgi:hypothetical protein